MKKEDIKKQYTKEEGLKKIQENIYAADKEIKAICKKYGVTLKITPIIEIIPNIEFITKEDKPTDK